MLQWIKSMVLKVQLFTGVAVALLLASATPAVAQMNIEITGVGQSLYPIAVMRFKDENKFKQRNDWQSHRLSDINFNNFFINNFINKFI